MNVVIVRVTSRRVSSFSNHARNTIQKDIFQSVFFLVQTRLLLAQREGFEPPDSCPSTVFKTAAFDRSAISAYILSFYVSGRMRSVRRTEARSACRSAISAYILSFYVSGRMRSVRRTEARSACRSAISAFKVQLFYQTKGGLSIKFTFCFGR